jgi:hypothetical protein
MAGQNSKTYRNLILPTKSSANLAYPFQITEYDASLGGTKPEGYDDSSNEKTFHMVRTGDCFRTFSYDPKHLINIRGINSGFEWVEDGKVFIDFTILGNLQPSGDAFVRCEKVGKDSAGKGGKDIIDPGGWVDYPSMFRLIPEDELDDNGYISKVADYQVQTKCYLLLGLRSDDSQLIDPKATKTSGEFSILQKANSNLIMMASQHRGTPVCFPMPWHGGANISGVVIGSSQSS